MKNVAKVDDDDDLRPEYDLVTLPGGVQGKYAHRFQGDPHLVRLDPAVATAFPDEKAVNEASRLLMELGRRQLVPSS